MPAYSPYNPTWNNPYVQPQLQQFPIYQTPPLQQAQQYGQQHAQQYPQQPRVDGPAEAMSRFLMRYPEQMLVPGFTTPDPIFDVNGKSFYALSIEADGRRNLEVFDYFPHAEMQKVTINGVTFDSQQEYDEFLAKVTAVIGEIDGIHGAVQASANATAAVPAATAPAADGTAAATAGV